MSLIRWKNQPTLSNFFDNFFDKDFFDDKNYYQPATNIVENKNSFDLEIAAPGMDKKDFKVSINDNILTISSEKEDESKEEGKNYARKEFVYGAFSRSFTLPETIDIDKIKAEYNNGILSIKLPKKDEAKMNVGKEIKIS